jgi:segregation and condensation protein B
MSLKAKLEAVVYAAEEPVTLAQLAVIFADEVGPSLNEAAAPEAEQIALEGLATEADAPAEAREPASSNSENGAAPEELSVAAEAGDEKKAARLRDRRIRQFLQQVLNELIADYSNSERGMEIREIAGGYRMATKPEYHDAVRGFVKSLKPPMKLSLQALETLAVIAYKQPVTAPEVSEIRGVDSGGVLGSLVSRKLITTAGRKPVIGRPILYKTTKEFLLRFGLKDVNDLPSMEEFEKMAGELAESEAEGEAQDAVNLSSEASAPAEAEQQSAEASEETTPSSEEATASSEEPTASSEEATASSEEATGSSEEPTTASEEPTTASEETTASSEEPTASSEESTTPSEEATTSSEEATAEPQTEHQG